MYYHRISSTEIWIRFCRLAKMYTFAESRGIRVRDDNPFQMKFISATTLVSSPKYMSHSLEWLFL